MNSLLGNSTVNQTLEQSLQKAQSVLTSFATAEQFTNIMTVAFGNNFDTTVAAALAADWAEGDFAGLPAISIRPTAEINNAMGAFAKATNTIYISQEYLAENAANPGAVAGVLLEEAGHYIDWRINEFETPGDEGAIFSALVRGEHLSERELQLLKAEDDSATIILDGQVIHIEQANITGTDNGETLNGTSGDDIINALGGDDTINSGLGYDTVDGGTGNDLLVVDYSANTAGEINSLFNSSDRTSGYLYAYNGSGEDVVSFSNIERFNITGTALNDSIYGGASNDILNGGDGDDTIDSGAGTDTVDGGTGNDTIYGGASNNILNGGSGDDYIESGAGDDTINAGLGFDNVDGDAGNDLLVVDYSADTYSGINTGFHSSDRTSGYLSTFNSYEYNDSEYDKVSFSNIERFNITGTALNDSIYGGASNDILNGGDGDDTIDSGAGTDTVDGDTGIDHLYVDYSASTSAINFTGSSSGTIATGAGQITYSNIEQFTVIGTAYNDTLTAASFSDTLNGGGGDDTINANAGVGYHTLDGGAGNDLLVVDYSANTYSGIEGLVSPTSGFLYSGSGILSFSNIERFNITGTTLNDTIYGGGASNDILNGGGGNDYIDSGAGTDTVDGGSGDDYIYGAGDGTVDGGTGNDSIYGGASNNILNGGGGDDYIDSGAGTDTVDGGTGTDHLYVDYSASTSAINFTGSSSGIIATGAGQITYSNIEQFTVTGGANNDTLTGGSLNDTLNGGGGDDTINAGLGYYDYVDGGAGNDLLVVDYSANTYAGIGINTGFNSSERKNGYLYTWDGKVDFFNIERFNITGTDLDDGIYGGANNDTLNGGGGDDYIDSGAGTDTVDGDTGTDHLYVDYSASTSAINFTGSSSGTIATGAGQITYSNIEQFTVVGGANNDTIKAGRGYDNYVDGGAGNDLLVVDYSANTYSGIYTYFNSSDRTSGYLSSGFYTFNDYGEYNGTGEDKVNFVNIERFNITGTILNDSIYGGANNDILNGGGGYDTLDGGAGIDTLIGSESNDTYIVDTTTDRITESATGGIDTVQASVTYTLGATSNLENLTLTGTSVINGTGNSLKNTITGNSAANVLNGGAGNDTMIGGAGNDTYYVDSTGDITTEALNEGTDTVSASLTWTLANNLENLRLTGTTAINGTGNALNNNITGNAAANTLTGGAGNDVLNGGAGADTLIGGAGDDTYYVDNIGDITTEAVSEGTDTVSASVTSTLADNLEKLTLTGTTAINGTGNALNNNITGNAAANTLNGGSGIDTLTGMAGNDILVGGLGNDVLTGGVGADSFRFNAANEGVDTIKDFKLAESDIIQISAAGFGGGLAVGTLDPSMFLSAAGATTATNSSQRFIYNSTNGALFFDADGNGSGWLTTQIATLTGLPALSNTHIVVIA